MLAASKVNRVSRRLTWEVDSLWSVSRRPLSEVEELGRESRRPASEVEQSGGQAGVCGSERLENKQVGD